MNTNRKINLEIVSHLAFWLIPSYLMIQFKMVQFGRELNTIEASMPFITNILFNAAIVYFILLYICPVYSSKKISRRSYLLVLLAIVILGAPIKAGINGLFGLYFNGHWFNGTSIGDLLFIEFFIVAFFVVQSVLYYFVKDWIRTTITNRKLNEEKLSLELKYLKSQINPHFLFNTLNNLYSIALSNKDQKTADGISQLSQIMRYMLNDQSAKEIFLDNEIEYLKSYIELQKLRFSETDDIKVTFNCEGETAKVKIPPFLFIVFVENAFKYGIDYKTHSFVDIGFEIKDHVLIFTASNSVKPDEVYQKHGIGLANIRERLNLLYKENHRLMVHQTENTYHVELEIKLNNHELLHH